MTQPQDPRLARILDHYGRDHQRWKLVEECGELLAELGRFRTGDRSNVADLIHEAADVIVVARQLYGFPKFYGSKFYEETTEDAKVDAWHLAIDAALLTNAAAHHADDKAKQWADAVQTRAAGLAFCLGAGKMLVEAIEMKTARQIERIEAEERE